MITKTAGIVILRMITTRRPITRTASTTTPTTAAAALTKTAIATYPTGAFVDFLLAKLTDIAGVRAVASISRGGQALTLAAISARISSARVKFLRTEFSFPT